NAAVRRFVSRVGAENLEDLFALREADAISRGDLEIEKDIERTKERVNSVLESLAAFRREDLAVDGLDVMRILGIQSGPKVGQVLKRLLEEVIEHPEWNERERLVMIIEGIKDNK
ncbi:MAG: polynucleotide adenylyltransferase, partial [Candidatus Krumholzibacteria bacterium]|nr:polynucleotide adenylyltransferase [Candidatus Krumholzibacteria bacterium]